MDTNNKHTKIPVGSVSKLNIKGEVQELQFYDFKETFGLKGPEDTGERQVSLMSHEAVESILLKEVKGLCMKRFKGNIETLQMDYRNLRKGRDLSIGDLVIEVSKARKKCHGTECPAFEKDQPCIMVQNILFGKILKPGKVRISDHILTEPGV